MIQTAYNRLYSHQNNKLVGVSGPDKTFFENNRYFNCSFNLSLCVPQKNNLV